jgi:DNA-binding MarR family transcriptional regulator
MGQSIAAQQWKPEEIGGNDWATSRQGELPCGVVEARFHTLEPHFVTTMKFAGAIAACLQHDGRSDEEIAKKIHISKGYMSKLLRSVWEAQYRRLRAFMRETRCVAPLQKLADDFGFVLTAKAPSEKDVLLRRLAEITAAEQERSAA